MTADLYGPGYFATRDDPRRTVMMRQEHQRIMETLGDPGVVVDIGCGDGSFLSLFPDARRFGVEVSEHAKTIARERGVEFDLPHGFGWADLVVMRGVLQHLPDPVGTLQRAAEWLWPGGCLVILATPNTASIPYRLFQTLPALDPPRNWTLWSAKTLRQTLTNVGFTVERTHYPYWRSPYRFAKGAFPRNMMEMYAGL